MLLYKGVHTWLVGLAGVAAVTAGEVVGAAPVRKYTCVAVSREPGIDEDRGRLSRLNPDAGHHGWMCTGTANERELQTQDLFEEPSAGA